MKKPQYRHRKAGGEVRKDGKLSTNQQRLGPLTLEARMHFFERICDIQERVARNNHTGIEFNLINPEEAERIMGLISMKVFPQKWSGEEPTGDIILDKVYADGSVMPVMFRDWIGESTMNH
jgi:DNA sulfur modification protein DndC